MKRENNREKESNVLKLSHNKSQIKLFTIKLLVMVSLTIVVFNANSQQKQANCNTKNIKINGTYLPTAMDIQDFQLTDNSGKSFTKENLFRQWTLVFFGFTNCPMVCPKTLAALNEMYHLLKNKLSIHQLPKVVFISIDPDRDSLARINEYITAFNSHFIGARADIKETKALMNQFHIMVAKIKGNVEGKDRYTITHSTEILVFNPNAKLQGYMSYPHYPKQLAKDYQAILHAYDNGRLSD